MVPFLFCLSNFLPSTIDMENKEKNGISISLYGALFLAVLGISFSFATGSQAVLLDGIFNCISVFTAWFALKISKMMDEIKQHPDKGWSILQDLQPLNYVLSGVLHHHENHNGRGYPDGLAGEQIPLDGRILAVVSR